jgi:hypothetical protein
VKALAALVEGLMSRPALRYWVVFAAAFALYFVSSGFAHPTGYNNYTLLADAWLHGHVWIDRPSPAIDAVTFGGKYYIVEAPMPAVLMLPFAIFAGTDANQTLVCVIAAAAFVAAADLLLGRMNISSLARHWMLAFAATGTVLWWCTSFPAVWMFAHVATMMFLTFGLAEWYGKRRFWLVGLLFGCAALSRFPAILAVLPFLYWTWRSDEKHAIRNVGLFVAGLAPVLLMQVAYNFARWDSPFDIGFTIFYHEDTNMGSPVGSPFGIDHIPFNLYSWIFLSPQFVTEFPWIRPTGFGVALTFTSPALLLAFLARRGLESSMLWISAILIAIPALLYFTNGFEQFGMRHTLDFTPFLLCLMARGLDRNPNLVAFVLLTASSIANAYGVWYSWAYDAFTVVPRY